MTNNIDKRLVNNIPASLRFKFLTLLFLAVICCNVLQPVTADSSTPVSSSLYKLSDKGVCWEYEAWRDKSTGDVNWPGVETDASLMQGAGINWARVSLRYTDDLSQVDRLVSIARRHSIKLDLLIGKAPPERDYGDPAQEAIDSSWLTKVVKRYKSYVKLWEIGNEPNITQSWDRQQPENSDTLDSSIRQYISYLAESYTIVKRVDPRATVLMAGFSEWKAESWLDSFRRQQGGQYTDGFAIHPYAADADSVAARLKTIIAKANEDPLLAGKPVWITEVGFEVEKSWQTPGFVGNEANKASNLSKVMQLLRAAGIKTPIFWYTLHELGPETHGYGLTIIDSGADGHETTQPAYDAYRAFNAAEPGTVTGGR